MRLFGSDQEPARRRRQTRRLRPIDRRSLAPPGVDPFPERSSVDERPHARAVERERREGFPDERLYKEDLVIVEPPEPLARANEDRRRHARNDTRSRFEMRGVRDGARLESNGTKSTPDYRRRTRNVFTEADLERARSLAAESRGLRVRHRDGGRSR